MVYLKLMMLLINYRKNLYKFVMFIIRIYYMMKYSNYQQGLKKNNIIIYNG